MKLTLKNAVILQRERRQAKEVERQRTNKCIQRSAKAQFYGYLRGNVQLG